MADPFGDAVATLEPIEGGYSNDPADSGGETHHGITVAVARAFGYGGRMAEMTHEQAAMIYRARYWDALRLDAVARLSVPIARELFDSAVNCGTATAGKWLQRSLNAMNNGATIYADVVADGAVGTMTLAALHEYMVGRGSTRAERVLLRALNSLQGAHYIGLAEERPKDERFAFGWFDQRVGIA